MCLFKKIWFASEVTSIIYSNYDKSSDRKVNIKLDFYSKDACNKKNNTPRPKINFKRCYDLKNGFESVSNFYELDEDKIEIIKNKIKSINDANKAVNKPSAFWKYKEHEEIHLCGKFGILFKLNRDNELFDSLKEDIINLVQ